MDPLSWIIVLIILANGRIFRDLEEENRYGVMAHSMKGIGKMIWPIIEAD
jgi:hypothetical protein